MANSKKRQQQQQTTTVHKEEIYQGKFLRLFCEKMTIENIPHQYDIVYHPGAAAILPFDSEGYLYFVKQWRSAAKEILLEIPAGILEKGETPAQCAERELREETGFYPGTLLEVFSFYTSPGFCTEKIHLFLAKDLEKKPLIGEDTHEIDLICLSPEETEEIIEKGQIKDAKTLLAFFFYKHYVATTSSPSPKKI